MATTDHPPRSTNLPRVVTFDDQVWPVNIAIAILASFAAGLVCAVGNFSDPRPWANAWVQLGIVALAAGALSWVSSHIDRRRMRRGLQLAMLTSLLLHMLLIIVLRSEHFSLLAEPRMIPMSRPRPVYIAPDYAFRVPGADTSEQAPPTPTSPGADTAPLARDESQPIAALPLDAPEAPPTAAEIAAESVPIDEPPEVEPAPPQLARRAARDVLPEAPAVETPPSEDPAPVDAAPPERMAGPAMSEPADSIPQPAPPSQPVAAAVPRPVPPTIPAAPLAERPDSQASSPASTPKLARRVAAPAPIVPLPSEPADEPSVAASEPTPSNTVNNEPPRAAIDATPGRDLADVLPARPPSLPGPGRPPSDLTPEVTPMRRAGRENDVARSTAPSKLSRRSAGLPAIDGRSREPAAAFARRSSPRPKDSGDQDSERTDAAIERGLEFLARHQASDGSWKLDIRPQGGAEPPILFRSDTAATGLALLSFLGAGYDHFGGEYQQVVQRALDYLVKRQRANGDLYQPSDPMSNRSARFYSHGIAAIALCEAYGMTGDRTLAGPAQRAINFIVASQDPQRGAWRYQPGSGSDTSVSGWQVMALKSGELAGLNVPPATYQKVRGWLDGAQVAGTQYVYNPLAPNTPEQGHGRRPTSVMTAVGLLMRLYTGWNRDNPQMVEGAENLMRSLPDLGTASRPERDTYYWYYATQVMFHMRGKYWRAWNSRLHPLLLDQQVTSGPWKGSWDPLRPVPDRWGPQAGRLYVTTMNLLSLEVDYRHLPIYDSTAH